MTNIDFRQRWPAPETPKPIVIIGAGGIVRDAHLPAYRKAGFPVRGLFDLDHDRAEALAGDWEVGRSYATLREAVEDNGTDAVYDLATPSDAITGILPELPEGAAVLIQKPMGSDLAQARSIRSICRERSLKAAVNFQLRFSPMMMAVQNAIRQGRLGDLLDIEVHLNIFTPWHMFPFLKAMDRVEISVHSIHYLDLYRAIAGNPLGVFTRTLADPRAPEFAQTRTSVLLDYPPPLRGLMTINHNHRGGRKHQSAMFRFEGTDGAMMVKLGLLYDYPNGEEDEVWICPNDGEWERIPLVGAWFPDAFIGTMSNVQRFDAGADEELVSSVDDAFQTMALVEACFEANSAAGVPIAAD